MATYYPNATNQRDLLPALYQRILGHETYNDSSFPANFMYLNYPSSVSYSDPSSECSHGQHSMVELPIAASLLSHESSAGASDVASSHVGDNFINISRDGKSLMVHPVSVPASAAVDHQMDGKGSLFPTSNAHGLSLSLGRHHLIQSFNCHASNSDMSYFPSHHSPARCSLHSRERYMYCEPDSQFPVINSRYLRAAVELLGEVVNVQGALKQKSEKVQCRGAQKENDVNLKSEKIHQRTCGSTPKSVYELSFDERMRLQNKMSKLLNMLDEVDQRYKQYYHQMQGLISSFDRIMGPGTAMLYTRLALETISRHFRSLRDAIDGQIRIMNMNHGDLEHQCHGDQGNSGIQRLRFVDQKLHRDRSFSQHSWRLQRGLPESSVSILRAWLFEHFLHPYPKDSDKLLLARQTGLTRNQVSNWFINARVRLWKPMVEEMYKEELSGDNGSNEGNNDDLDSTSDGDGKSPCLTSPMEVIPLPPHELKLPENPIVSANLPAIIGVDSGSSVVSLTLGLHHNHGCWSTTAVRPVAEAVLERGNGSRSADHLSGTGPGMDHGSHLVGKEQRVGSSQLLLDFAVLSDMACESRMMGWRIARLEERMQATETWVATLALLMERAQTLGV